MSADRYRYQLEALWKRYVRHAAAMKRLGLPCVDFNTWLNG
jgi:hypothetical protein